MEDLSLKLGKAGSLLGNRPFRRLWAAQFCATAAVYGLSLAAIVRVEEQTQSSAQTAVVILSAILPAFLGSLVSGVVVDRFGRVRVLAPSHLGRALVALAFWGAAELIPPGQILIAVFATNTALALLTQFAMPAEFALLPDLVGQERLMPANAVLQLSWLTAEALGIVFLSPLVIKLFGVPAVGLAGAALCLLALALVMGLPKDEAKMDQTRKRRMDWGTLGSDLQAGWRTIMEDRLLMLVVIQATLAATLLLVLVALLPGLASRHLGFRVEDAALLLLPGGLGFVLGLVLLSRGEDWLSRPAWIALGLMVLGIGASLLGIMTNGTGYLPPVLVLVLGMGTGLALVIIPARTVLQERPPASTRGRVIAAQLALANAAAVLPLLLGGVLADRVGIKPVLGSLGLLTMGVGVLGMRYARNRDL